MAKKNAPPPGDKADNNELMVVAGIVLIAFVLWTTFHQNVATLVLFIRQAEASLVALVASGLDAERYWMRVIDRKSVTMGDLWEVSSRVGNYLRWVTAPVLMGLGIWLMRKSPTERFRTRFTDVTLPRAVANLYPWMKISTKIDFSEMDIETGNWARPKTERQFVKQHKLRKRSGELDRDRAEAVFIRQMGPFFLDYASLRPHVKALFALFATRANKDFQAGDDLLIQLAASAAEGRLDYTHVDELAQKYMDSDPVQRVVSMHAYERTVLMSLLEKARGGERGKDLLPPNWFLWVKGVDRTLWYALSDVGRQTPHPECAGVFCHWQAEKILKEPIVIPFVVNAVDGLVIELAKFTNDDEHEDEGLGDADDLLVVRSPPPVPAIPSPQEAETQRAVKNGGRDTSS